MFQRFVPVVVAVLLAALLSVPTAAQAAPVLDGRSPATAAASCWEIKQDVPAARNGRYWLLTPQLRTPTQFYCDMTTDGGGWVLVGRGRDGWDWGGDANGTPADVAGTVTGRAAFAPKKLSNAMIDGLLNGQRVDALTDGVRLRRAKNTAGSSWQEVRFAYASRDSWNWSFGPGYELKGASFDGTVYGGNTTRDFGYIGPFPWFGRQFHKVWTYDSDRNGYMRGFNYDYGVRAPRGGDGYLTSVDGAWATPFTQVFIRPKLRSANLSWSSISDTGTARVEQLPVARSGSAPQPWSVTGMGAGGDSERSTEAHAFAQIGNVVYVGGNFTTVRNQSGSERVSQAYLAGFNASTGEWIRGFRPTLNGQVHGLVKLPNGRLAVGGDFDTVNGQKRTGLAVLNTDGSLDTSWDTMVENRAKSEVRTVKVLKVSGDYLYVGGQFTHIVKGGSAWFQRNGARISLGTGRGQSDWNPNFNGVVYDVDISTVTNRAYFAGFQTASGTTPVGFATAISTEPGAAVIPWSPHYSFDDGIWQLGIKEIGSKVWMAGGQHAMFSFAAQPLGNTPIDQNITKFGGDFQTIVTNGTVVYGGCHCGNWNYSGVDWWDYFVEKSDKYTGKPWTVANKISLVGGWDAASGRYLSEFAPDLKSRGGYGVWGSFVADDGTLWVGGSLTDSMGANGRWQYTGGFARFTQRPATAPATPSAARGSATGSKLTLSWDAVSGSGITYEVLRNDRVVALTGKTSISIPGYRASDRYFVRATDGAGNYSASTSRVSVTTAGSDGTRTELVGSNASWRYRVSNDGAPPTDWAREQFSDSSWSTGAAPLGWGSDQVETNVDVAPGRARPLTSYFRTTFTVSDPASFRSFDLSSWADDGVVLYVNGVEVKRANLPDGPVSAQTAATSAPSTYSATANPVTTAIPAGLIHAGTNTIAAEVHLNWRSSPSMSFGARVTAQR